MAESPHQSTIASVVPQSTKGLKPILLALMAVTLPVMRTHFAGVGMHDGPTLQRLIDKADDLLLAQVPELCRIAKAERCRYWRSLLEAMIEDNVMAV